MIYLLRFVFLIGNRGALMDDAMILPCGHSFGSGGIQHVLRVVSYWQEHCSSILLKFCFHLYHSSVFFYHAKT